MFKLKENAIKYPDRIFINNLSYSKVINMVENYAKRLDNIVKNQKRVAIYSNNCIDMVIAILSLLVLKKEVFCLNFHLSSDEITKQTKLLDIDTILSCNDNFISFDSILKNPKSSIDLDWSFDNEKIAIILNTSATSGSPKSVPITWGMINAHCVACAKSLGVDENDCWGVVLPMFHIGGLSILFRTIHNATAMKIYTKFEPEIIDLDIQNGNLNMISLVPTMLKRMNFTKHNLRVVLLGGEFIDNALVKQCLQKNIRVYKTYGMSEHTSQISTFCVNDNLDNLQSVGRLLDGVQILIQNPDKSGIGEISIKSKMLFNGYLGGEKIDGFFNTKDIGYLQNGFLYILNRRDDLIISGGENIYPKEIENALYDFGVKECVLLPKKDEKWGQIGVLFVSEYKDKSEILDFLLGKFAKYKIPKEIIILDTLPKNSTGKIDRATLKAMIENS